MLACGHVRTIDSSDLLGVYLCEECPGLQVVHHDLLSGEFNVGARVKKSSGDYTFEGEVRAIVCKRSGEVRYVVEDDRGLLMIMSAKQLERV
jgi:hypothetical protein